MTKDPTPVHQTFIEDYAGWQIVHCTPDRGPASFGAVHPQFVPASSGLPAIHGKPSVEATKVSIRAWDSRQGLRGNGVPRQNNR